MLKDNFDTFGSLLHDFRKRSHLTQQQLAELVGMHRHAIIRWEQGSVLPASKAIVLELAQHLHLNEQETRQLLEVSFTAPAPLWGVPLPRNIFFTGREDMLDILYTYLQPNPASTSPQAIALSGLAGIGKTQIALEYAYRHALEYRAIFWIEAESLESVYCSLQRIAELLQLPERTSTGQHRILEAVQHWLNTHDQWLLVWDNLEDLELLSRMLPLRQGALLLTTCQQALGTFARCIRLEPFKHEDSVLLLLRRAKILQLEATEKHMLPLEINRPAEYIAASDLAVLLGGLPLALDQAGAFTEETGCSLDEYLRHYQSHQIPLLKRRGGPGSAHPQSVITTFSLAFAQVEQEQEAAAILLRAYAFLYAEAIPEELFRVGAEHLEPALAALVRDPIQFDLALAVLRKFSLIQRHAESQTLSLHRLVQVSLREQMSPTEESLWSERLVGAINSAFPAENDIATWGKYERYLPQALACVPLINLVVNAVPEAVELLSKVGRYLISRGRLEEAEPLIVQAVSLSEQQYEPDCPELVLPLKVQAELAWQQGKFAHAEELLWRVLAVEEQHLEQADVQIANTLYLLALYCWEQGKYAQAEPLFQRALRLWEHQSCLNHPDSAFLLHYLGVLYWKQGKYELAQSLYQRAILIIERALGPDHPHVAFPLLGLATIFEELGKYTQARSLFQHTLSIREQALGPDHPRIAYSLNGLASLYAEEGKYAQAEQLYQRSLRIREQMLGADHPEVSYTLSGLGKLYARQGKYEQAKTLYQRALHIRDQTLQPDHPDIASLLNNLAKLYRDQGYYTLAEPLFQQALHIRVQRLGVSHLKTAQTLMAFAQLYEKQGKTEQAESLIQQGCAIFAQYQELEYPEFLRNKDQYCTQLNK